MSDVTKIIEGQLVEWDNKKAAINKQKHGISFETAAMVFTDENRIERRDDRHSQDEDRWQVIGKVEDVLFVVYTERGDVFRLITARMANEYERRIYDGAKNYL